MNISSGIAEIRFGSIAPSEKFYLWPLYAAGRVEPIRGVARRTDGLGVYLKPTDEERARILALSRERPPGEYTARGRLSFPDRPLLPGAFFDARV